MGRIIGIDLGTTNSLAACWENGESRLIPNSLGEYLTPSVVSIDENGNVYVGKVAKERLVTNPDRTVSVFKRSMGTEKIWQIGGRGYTPVELSALVLRRLKEDAEAFFGEPVEEAIVSVPAYFNEKARKATRDAGLLAGLTVERIVNEPSAAALACQQMRLQSEAKILVYDFGGGTLDVSLVECFENVVEIVAVSGNNRLGGSDFDQAIARAFCSRHGWNYPALPRHVQELLLRSAEQAKIALTTRENAVMRVSGPEYSGELELTSKEMIRLCGQVFKKMAEPVQKVLLDGKVRVQDLTDIILVGGSCKMPAVRQYLSFLLKTSNLTAMEPDTMVARGIGVYAGIKERKDDVKEMVLTDICPFSLGVETLNKTDWNNGLMSTLISRNSTLPSSRERSFYTVADDQQIIRIPIYQGEDLFVKNNLFLGEITVRVLPAPAGKEEVRVRFSYDINGLLVVDVHVPSTGEKKRLVLVQGRATEADEQLQKQIEKLEKLREAPRDQEENVLLLSRAQSMYIQLLDDREKLRLSRHILAFQAALESGSPAKIHDTKLALTENISRLEREAMEFHDTFDPDVDAFLASLDRPEREKPVTPWGNEPDPNQRW